MTDSGVRQLKAILFSDVKSFSAMMSENEARTIRLIKEHREIVREILAGHGGEEHGTAGDSFFVLFASAVEAVQCAVEIQEAFHRRNAGRPPEEQIWIRIGIHLGDIVVDEGDGHVYGEGINIAARTEPKAEPGGICITQDVFQQVQRKIDLKVIAIGRQEMKNIVDAPELYRIIVGRLGGAAGAVAAQPITAKSKRATILFAVTVGAAAVVGALAFFLFQRAEGSAAGSETNAVAPARDAGVAPAASPSPDTPPRETVDSSFPGKVLVSRFLAPPEHEGLAAALSALVANRLTRHYPDGVLTHSEARGLVGGTSSGEGRTGGSGDPVSLAERVRATRLVLGEITPVKNGVWANLSFVDVASERVVNRISERTGDDPEEAIRTLETSLVGVLSIPVEGGGDRPRSAHLVQAYIRSRIGFVKYCYESQLREDPELAGRLVIAFTISEEGVFRDVHVLEDESSLKNDALNDCVAEVFDGLGTGLDAKGGGDIEVHYPFEFSPDG